VGPLCRGRFRSAGALSLDAVRIVQTLLII
jgi:hypothetical protein